MGKRRDIIVNVIKINDLNNRRIAEFFAKKYIEKEKVSKEKS